MGPSSAGTIGHMQFMPATWAAYRIDANRDGDTDPSNAEDAIQAQPTTYTPAAPQPTGPERCSPTATPTGTSASSSTAPKASKTSATNPPPPQPNSATSPPTRSSESSTWRHGSTKDATPTAGAAATPQPPAPQPEATAGPRTAPRPSAQAKPDSTAPAPSAGSSYSPATRTPAGSHPDPSFDDVYPRGRGRAVTIWSNANHVFIHIRGKGFWGTTQTNYRHGPGWISSYPTAGFAPSHPPGL